MRSRTLLVTVLTLALAVPLFAQSPLTLPPSGKNQPASVTQSIGLVKVTIDYSGPRVHQPDTGEDRRGKIWGGLVPYGLTDLGFGSCKECPWRAGANENTVFTVSHDVQIEGKPLPAGSYGFHIIPGENEWTLIFSKDHTSWGSYFYNPAEDALRVKVKPEKSEYHEWLTYSFPVRETDHAVAALNWEDLGVKWKISVPNSVDLYMDNIRRELRSTAGFTWQGWNDAANFALQTKSNLKEGLEWAKKASSGPTGRESFQTLATLAQLQEANGMAAEAEKTMAKAVALPGTSAIEIHGYGRSLLNRGKKAEALKVFEMNAKMHPGQWPVDVGLARGYAANGQNAKALKHAKLALQKAPDEQNKKSLAAMVKTLEEGKEVK